MRHHEGNVLQSQANREGQGLTTKSDGMCFIHLMSVIAPTSMIDTAVDPPYTAPTIDSAYERRPGVDTLTSGAFKQKPTVRRGKKLSVGHEPDFDFLDGFSDRFLAQIAC